LYTTFLGKPRKASAGRKKAKTLQQTALRILEAADKTTRLMTIFCASNLCRNAEQLTFPQNWWFATPARMAGSRNA
jgi:hypothetical protein